MRIKRYFGTAVRQAIQKLRQGWTPDAMIPKNNSGGKIAAAIGAYGILGATMCEFGLDEVIRTYKKICPTGCSLTKLNEVVTQGGVSSLVVRHKSFVAHGSNGRWVPEGRYTARARSVLSRNVAKMRRAAAEVDHWTMAETASGQFQFFFEWLISSEPAGARA